MLEYIEVKTYGMPFLLPNLNWHLLAFLHHHPDNGIIIRIVTTISLSSIALHIQRNYIGYEHLSENYIHRSKKNLDKKGTSRFN